MAVLVLAAMIGIPIIEIAVFIEVGGRLGVWPTLGIVIATAVVGTALLRHQGLSTLARVQESLGKGRFPAAELFDGLCLLIAGTLLLTPGFVTDGAGLLLFVPALRTRLGRLIGGYMVRSGRVEMHSTGPRDPASGQGDFHRGPVIEGEFSEVENGEAEGDTESNDRGSSSPWHR